MKLSLWELTLYLEVILLNIFECTSTSTFLVVSDFCEMCSWACQGMDSYEFQDSQIISDLKADIPEDDSISWNRMSTTYD